VVNSESQDTVLIIHPGTLGDVLLALSAIRALRAAFYDHEIGLIAGTEPARVLHACKEIDASFSLESQALTGLLAGSESITPVIRSWLDRCGLVIGWMSDPNQRLSVVLHDIGVPRVIIRSPSICSATHQGDRFLETIQSVVQSQADSRKLRLPDGIIEQAKSRLVRMGIAENQPLMLLHPGSGSRHKCSDPSLFGRIVEWCGQRGITPLVVGGPADDEMMGKLLTACVQRPLVLQHLDLLSIAGVLVHSALFIGHDSGLTHLAAALRVPTIALFGPTNPQRWAPRGSNAMILTGKACRCEGWSVVQLCREKPCLQIPIEQVISTCSAVLESRRNVNLSELHRLVLMKELC